MRKSSTFLRLVVYLIGLVVLALCVLVLPMIGINMADRPVLMKWIVYTMLIGMYISAVPFLIALIQALKLLTYIDKNKAFSVLSVDALKVIKHCALAISGVYTMLIPLIYIIGEKDDAPGIILIGLVIIFASFVIAVFASLLQKLLRNAIDIKIENDLTV
ncbi:hypothetical protein BN1058_01994 [Paraliobacillus sp. PM-2]|uniref:DUF2975 domain-containing protein n=1 Tax=Paraliobacillus sp. PM-2 TaxID=1462524 RepID=UPI00061C4037|nr:DUF2975 domain-containing protein [Paraliobacillus sp. PM-2]CQR47667.1 hypothetical protein BN1058_01994 [Paraliobacillus sp. PM-2]